MNFFVSSFHSILMVEKIPARKFFFCMEIWSLYFIFFLCEFQEENQLLKCPPSV